MYYQINIKRLIINCLNLKKIIHRYKNFLQVSLTFHNSISKTAIEEENRGRSELYVFCHHIYEYKKGLRNLVLTTERAQNRKIIEKRLKKENIPYVIHDITNDKINIYFGKQHCIDVVSTFDSRLNKLTPEQDFILGIMLGYDRLGQCERYLKRFSMPINNLIDLATS